MSVATKSDRRAWPDEAAAGAPLDVVVIARNIEGIDGGLYGQGPTYLEFVGEIPTPTAAETDVPEWVASAPAIVVVLGNLAASCARHGEHGLRHLLVRGGEATYCSLLAALSLGLSTCLFAGLPNEIMVKIEDGGLASRPLLSLVLGLNEEP